MGVIICKGVSRPHVVTNFVKIVQPFPSKFSVTERRTDGSTGRQTCTELADLSSGASLRADKGMFGEWD